MIKEVRVLENILTSTPMHIVKDYGLKADPELLGNTISIVLNNISARKYTHSPRSSVYLYIFSLRNSTGSPELFRVTTCNHGSALMLCKSLQSRAVFLHLNVDLLKPYKSVLFVKRERNLFQLYLILDITVTPLTEILYGCGLTRIVSGKMLH